jgi:hypothetical protein
MLLQTGQWIQHRGHVVLRARRTKDEETCSPLQSALQESYESGVSLFLGVQAVRSKSCPTDPPTRSPRRRVTKPPKTTRPNSKSCAWMSRLYVLSDQHARRAGVLPCHFQNPSGSYAVGWDDTRVFPFLWSSLYVRKGTCSGPTLFTTVKSAGAVWMDAVLMMRWSRSGWWNGVDTCQGMLLQLLRCVSLILRVLPFSLCVLF